MPSQGHVAHPHPSRAGYWRGGSACDSSQRYRTTFVTSALLIRALPVGRSVLMRAASASKALTSLGSTLKDKMTSSPGGRVLGLPTLGILTLAFRKLSTSIMIVFN